MSEHTLVGIALVASIVVVVPLYVWYVWVTLHAGR